MSVTSLTFFAFRRALARLPILAGAAILGACAGSSSTADTLITEPIAQATPAVYHPALHAQAEFAGVPRTGKAILVNIPSFELIAFEDGKPVLRSRVIIGKPATPTPEMDTETSVVRFRPTWRPTPTMVRSGKYKDKRWPAGPRNPLGLLAIRLEPGMLIYLHGTNKPQLFERDRRALSHGCVRVERWDDVAAWVLDVDLDTVHEHAKGRRTFDMETGGVPVLVRYYTRFPDEAGIMQHYPDIYGRGEYAAEDPKSREG